MALVLVETAMNLPDFRQWWAHRLDKQCPDGKCEMVKRNTDRGVRWSCRKCKRFYGYEARR